MARESNIKKYPPELIALIDQCLDDPKIIQQKTVELVNNRIRDQYLDENELTPSALGRYAKKRRENHERALQMMAQQKVYRDEYYERFGGSDLDQAGRFNVEMLMPVMTKLIGTMHLIEDDTTPEQANLHAKTIKLLTGSLGDLEKTLSESKSRNDAIKKEAREQAQRDAVEAMETEAKKHNQAEDVTVALRKAIMSGLKNG